MTTSDGDHVLPPSVIAAKRTTSRARARSDASDRPYAAVEVDDDLEAVGAHLAATRALLVAATADEVARIVVTLVHDLGGGVVPARLTGVATALPLDVSLGCSEPLLPHAEPVSVAAMRLSRILPTFVEDARTVVAGLRDQQRLAGEAERDAVTGLLTSAAWMRRLAAATTGDTVSLIALDHGPAADGAAGRAAGDAALAVVGPLLLRYLRTGDAAGRDGVDSLACLTPGMQADAAARRLGQLRAAWVRERPAAATGTGFSVGLATIDERGPAAALAAARRALHRLTCNGRNGTATARPADHDDVVEA